MISGVTFNPPKFLEWFPSLLTPTPAEAGDVDLKSSISSLPSRFHIEINIPSTELTLYEEGEILKKIRIAVGSATFPTPIYRDKTLELRHIIWNPDWTPPKSGWAENDVYTPPGPNNPLGVVKMPIYGTSGILLHGTNKPRSIGQPASHGCLRIKNEDAKDLAWIIQQALTAYSEKDNLMKYETLRNKTFHVPLDSPIAVAIHYEPVEIVGNEMHVYQDVYKKVPKKAEHILSLLTLRGILESRIDLEKIKEVSKEWHRGKKITLLVEDLLKTDQG